MIKLGPEIIGKKVRIIEGSHACPVGSVGKIVTYDTRRARGGVVTVYTQGYGRGSHWAENVEGFNDD